MSVCRKCDICGKIFDLGFSVEVCFQGGMYYQNINRYEDDLGKMDVCEDCFYKIKKMASCCTDTEEKR